jgi:hypothetical protein
MRTPVDQLAALNRLDEFVDEALTVTSKRASDSGGMNCGDRRQFKHVVSGEDGEEALP